MSKSNCLFEIGTEELPAKMLEALADALKAKTEYYLEQAKLEYDKIKRYATPRRLAVHITDLSDQQPSQLIEKKGPSLERAYDAAGQPTAALKGFARKCQLDIDQLVEEDGHVVCRIESPGKPVEALLPAIFSDAVANLPIEKPMRWGETEVQFIRPVRWVVLLYGSEIVPANILGCQADRLTYGHRFMHPEAIVLEHADDYETALKNNKVIACFESRKEEIRKKIEEEANNEKCLAFRTPIIGSSGCLDHEQLLNEVTGLVEWPVVLCGKFDDAFLALPDDVIDVTLKTHQKCFSLRKAEDGSLSHHFCLVSNIESLEPEKVIRGNERVVHARLSDAKFFYELDRKETSEDRLEKLKSLIFHPKLGSLYDKSERISKLAGFVAEKLGLKPDQVADAQQAARLCKTDLASHLVNEFPELEGKMAYHYASEEGKSESIAKAMNTSNPLLIFLIGNELDEIRAAVLLADSIDTLVGMFGIHQIPTGSKDPYALRRAANFAVMILTRHTSQNMTLRLKLNDLALIEKAYQNYPASILSNPETVQQVKNFIRDRIYAQLPPISTKEILESILATDLPLLGYVYPRAEALKKFKNENSAEIPAFIEVYKRVSQLLKKASEQKNTYRVEKHLLKEDAEKNLYEALEAFKPDLDEQIKNLTSVQEVEQTYGQHLKKLADLQKYVANFFDHIMVMDPDEALRNNRLALLHRVHQLFLKIADFSLLNLTEL